MSPLIPTNLSNGAKERRKQARPNTWSPLDYPEFVWEGMPHNAPATDERLQPKPDQKTNDEAHKKTSAVPVVMVNPDPLQMMEPDEYGAELGKEARVWKVYVKETDRWDAELVGGWNKCVMLLAALFSAVSTAFLIESSRKLQQDPSDVSAAALLRISQTLVAMTTNSSVELPPISPKSQLEPGFVPSRNAIVVNTLWYLSLSLSIATSLLAMLAKDWCHSFAANRTGHPWDQALRRQRKWVMIERWGVRELFIAVLPFLIHLSLLVFAVGLCIYVWDMNSTVAIPLICVCGLALGFYLWSSVMASFVKLFPYTTIISRALRMYVETLRSHQPHESDSDQDQMTSLAVKWLIQTCNTPGSVAIALQAIAGASPRIPKGATGSMSSNPAYTTAAGVKQPRR
ncbi:transmembrane protein, putative [Rhizoctonia solani AG-3 Rhs1AP]|uniref:Transmembrane protein, putative n=1 Tax=Rhizoctonia solani AG-3 Rhs1AP TaxID=1086054 RepID=X8J1L6_9AGAM|nr:transmembrane protein, putative [Rhizoctonia solani AG-3 Rhs1AP]